MEDGEIEDARLSSIAAKDDPPPVAVQDVALGSKKETIAELVSIEPTLPKPAAVPQQESTTQTISQGTFTLETVHSVQPSVQDSVPKPLPPSAPNHSLASNQLDPSRTTPANATNGRLQHSLPSRPEVPPTRLSEHRLSDRPSDRGPRDPRFLDRGRSERPLESLRDRAPDYNLAGTYPRGYGQPNDRPHIQDRNRAEPGWGDEKLLQNRSGLDDRHDGPRRESRPPSRDGRTDRPQRDRASNEQHPPPRTDFPAQPPRESAMAPPRSNIIQHPERAALIQGSQEQHLSRVNRHSDRRSDPSRYENYPASEQNSRGVSPDRSDDRRPPRRDDRLPIDSRRPNEDGTHSHPSRYGDSYFPTGPRTDRSAMSALSGSNDRFRDAMKAESTTIQAVDPNIGRLSQDSSHHVRQPESQYGRLNQTLEIPSGPRLSNGNHPPPSPRGGRTVSAPQPQINTQMSQTVSVNAPLPSPVMDKQTPTGPSSIRGLSRNSASFSRPEPTPTTAPMPAKEAQDTAAVHPDRLNIIQGNVTPSSINTTPIQVNTARNTSQPQSAVLLPTPAGPRGPGTQLPSPTGPSPTNRGPPTGPSFGAERNRGDKRFAGIQNMLQQSSSPNGIDRSGQGASIRGRGGRANHVSIPSPSASGPATPSGARPEAYPPRGDLFAARSSDPSTPQHGDEDLAYGRSGRGGREMPREGERRSERHQINRSHSRDNVTGPPMPLRDEERLARREDMRERVRGNGLPPLDREIRRPSGREEHGRGRRLEPPDRREMDEWPSARRGGELDRRDERERREGGSSGRKRGRMGDEGPGERGHLENKRSRRIG